MTTQTIRSSETPPSARTLILTLSVALLIAATVLVTTVLPAEFGVDPIGTGRLLGLTALSDRSAALEMAAPLDAASLTPIQIGPVGHFGAEYKMDSAEIILGPYQYAEYKYRLEKGATMLYAWTASAAPEYDFHADPDGDPKPDPVSFDKESKLAAQGAFTAPFSGIHGWFWENPGGEPLTITLTTAGFYSAATEFRSDRTRRAHTLTPLDRVSIGNRGVSP